ncbi:hypothetical protein QG37_06122 [Candidozyma auris]|uniref:Uncharacterized protein n=1 Tax=Candidozyma auris TaxID=498019 RepID=A0A0L0NUP1_CANAR|nr:hypothetical protein QG37_06122 [[Candida] auris]
MVFRVEGLVVELIRKICMGIEMSLHRARDEEHVITFMSTSKDPPSLFQG